MYNKGYTGTRPIIELLKCGKREFEEIPIHGQIDLLETMEEYE